MIKTEISDPVVKAEMSAMGVVYAALRPLPQTAQRLILQWVIDRLELRGIITLGDATTDTAGESEDHAPTPPLKHKDAALEKADATEAAATTGINPVAQKWLMQSGIGATALSGIFSLNFDEIDLVATAVAGKGVRERMKSTILLKCIASYLGTGAARVAHDKAKEAAVHYNAYDANNFAWYMKGFSKQISGSKESGYSLTPFGMTEATSLIKQMLANPPDSASRPSVVKKSPKATKTRPRK